VQSCNRLGPLQCESRAWKARSGRFFRKGGQYILKLCANMGLLARKWHEDDFHKSLVAERLRRDILMDNLPFCREPKQISNIFACKGL
jgi:hypothetical protein